MVWEGFPCASPPLSANPFSKPLTLLVSGMGFHNEIRSRHVDLALTFAVDTSILTALSKAIPQGKRRLDREPNLGRRFGFFFSVQGGEKGGGVQVGGHESVLVEI